MAITLASLKKTAPKDNPFVLLYGVEKVGKTALAAEFPNPVIMLTSGENPPKEVVIDKFALASFEDFDQAGEALFMEDHAFKTLILDSADGLERMIIAEACRRNGWRSIEDPGFGKGWVAVSDIWNEVMFKLNALRDERGMTIILIAHAETWRFDSPTSEPYARYRPNVRKNTADLIQAASDIIAFINHRVSIKKEDVGFKNTAVRGEGAGIRMIYLDERPGFIAGNRYSMPSEITFNRGKGYTELAKHLPKPAEAA